MNLNIGGLHILSSESLAKIRNMAVAEGHTIVEADKSAIASLWAEAKAKFPALVADIQRGIADVKDQTISGGDKAVKVAEDVLEAAPDAIKALPDAKDFLVHGVTELFAETKAALVTAATDLLGKL